MKAIANLTSIKEGFKESTDENLIQTFLVELDKKPLEESKYLQLLLCICVNLTDSLNEDEVQIIIDQGAN